MLDSPILEPRPTSYTRALDAANDGQLVFCRATQKDGEPCVAVHAMNPERVAEKVLRFHLSQDPDRRGQAAAHFATFLCTRL